MTIEDRNGELFCPVCNETLPNGCGTVGGRCPTVWCDSNADTPAGNIASAIEAIGKGTTKAQAAAVAALQELLPLPYGYSPEVDDPLVIPNLKALLETLKGVLSSIENASPLQK